MNEAVEFEVIRTEPPPPPPPPPEPEPAPEPEPPAPKPPPKRIVKAEPPPPAEPLPPPPPNAPPPKEEAAPAPIKIGVSLSSTTEGGSFAVGTGNTLYGKSDEKAADPSTVKPYAAETPKAAPFVPSTRLTRIPTVKRIAAPAYPEWARVEGIEGRVLLNIRIDETGKVIEVRLLRGLGRDFDERAIAAVKNAQFNPGISDGRAVVTEINYTITYMIE